MVRLGLIGANKQGLEHVFASTCCQDVAFVAAIDTNKQTCKSFQSAYPNISVFSDAYEFFRVPVDGYVLALPHHVYEGIWATLMTQGKPLLKEKPLGRTLKEAAQFLSECKKYNVPLVTAIQRRNHASYIHLKNLVQGQTIRTVTATLHLGFDPTNKPDSWRGVPISAGGGALLDSGYHMVDLVFFFLSHLHLIDANIWFNGRLGTAEMLDTDAFLIGRSGQTWVRVESCVGGEAVQGQYQKKELIQIETENGLYEANREWVKKDGVVVYECSKKWTNAMADQLEHFGAMITSGQFDTPKVWDQVSIMEIIEKAYSIANLKAPFEGGYDV